MTGARFVPWLVLSLGLGTSIVLYTTILGLTTRRNAASFKTAIASLESDVNDAIHRQVSVLHATAGAVSANPGIDRPAFTTFYNQLTFGQSPKDQEAIGYSITRSWDRRQELAEDAAKRGVQGFNYRPPGTRKEANAVILIEPLDTRNKIAPGYDMAAEATRAEAMSIAKNLGSPVMTSKIYLAKDEGNKVPSFIIYVPVKDGRTAEPIGFVYSGIHAAKLFKDLFEVASPDDTALKGLALTLWSGERTGANQVYRYDHLGPDDRILDTKNVEIDLPEVHQKLSARFVQSSAFGTQGQIRPWVLPVGSVISIMLFMLATVLRRAQETSERRESEQALLAEVGRLTLSAAEDARVLTEIAYNIAETLSVVCRIDILEPDGTLRTVNTRTEHKEALAELEREFPRLTNDPLLRAALETGATQSAKALLGNDDAHRAKIAPMNVGPVVIVPMIVRERAFGALTLTRTKGETALTKDEVALLEAIAGRIALAVDNARLYEAIQEENDDLERRVEERTRDLEASNHELESFCYSVSHDLRTPLRSLDGFGRALKEDYGEQLDEQAHDYIDRIRASTKRMDELITALLTLSRLTRREILPSTVDATTMVRDLFHDLDPENKVELELEDGLEIFADGRMLAIVFENLLSNAIKFSSRGDHPKIVVGKTPDNAIFVRDNGAGFDMQYANKLFQPFERLHSVREFPGHGIGLATVERIVRRHGGEVRAEGELGVGATFFIRFPSQI